MASPQLQTVIQKVKEMMSAPPAGLDDFRTKFEAFAAQFNAPKDVTATPVSAGGVPAEWIVAHETAEDRVVLYVHGGGYVIGSINTHRELISRLSKAANARVLALNYRLAPEHPFPAAVEDATAAYRWLLSQGIKPNRVVVAGDSAGGGLTIATLLSIRDAKLPTPAAGVCISPWVDMEGIGETMKTKASVDPMVQKDGLQMMASMYLNGKDPRTPLAAPLYADLKGLPPLLIHVGEAETLLDDSKRITERAKAAGVNVKLEVWPDMVHVWHMFAAVLPEAQEAIEGLGKFVREQTA
jgi:phosphinothricin tripeptide acetyl hydrolase